MPCLDTTPPVAHTNDASASAFQVASARLKRLTIISIPVLRAVSLLRPVARDAGERRDARRLIPFFFRPIAFDPEARQKTLYSLQIGRGLAALAVLFYHANLIIGLPKYFDVRPADVFMPGGAGVNYFFVLSGFVIMLAHWRDLTGKPDIANFAWKRFRRIYPLLWVVLCPLVILMVIAPSYSPAGAVLPRDLIAALAIAPPLHASYAEPFLIVEWTLRYEIVFYLLFLVLLKSRVIFAVLTLPLLIASVTSLSNTVAESVNFWIAPYFLLFFMGMAGGWAFKSLPIGRPAWLLIPGLAGLVACAWIAYRTDVTPLLTVGIGLASVLVVVGAARAETGRPSTMARVFTFVGDASYSIYLVHYPLLSISTKILMRVTSSPYLAFTAAIGLALAGGIACHLIVERPLLRRIPRRPPGFGRIVKES